MIFLYLAILYRLLVIPLLEPSLDAQVGILMIEIGLVKNLHIENDNSKNLYISNTFISSASQFQAELIITKPNPISHADHHCNLMPFLLDQIKHPFAQTDPYSLRLLPQS